MFDKTRYHPSSELHRAAEQAAANEARRLRWRAKFTLRMGREPVDINHQVLNPFHAAVISSGKATNANVIKFRRHKGQFKPGLLPEPPEAV